MSFISQFKTLSKNSLYFGVGGAAVKFISFFTAPILTRVFSPSDFGIIDLISTSLSFFLMVASLNVNSGLLRYYYEVKDFDSRKKLTSTSFYTVILWGGLILAIFIMLKPQFSSYLQGKSEIERNYSLFLTIIFFRVPFNLCHGYFLTLFILRKKVKFYIFITVFQVILNLIFLMVFLLIFKLGLAGVFLAGTLSVITVSFISFFNSLKFIGLSFSLNYFKKVMQYAIPQLPGVFFSWGIFKSNRFFLQDLCPENQLGYFALVAKIGIIVNISIHAFRLAWGPFSMEALQKADYKSVFNKFFKVVLIFFSLIAFVVTVNSKLLIKIIATKEYMSGYIIIVFFVFALVLRGVQQVLGIGIAISKRTKYSSYALGMTFLFSLLANYFLIKNFQALGAGIALLLCFVFQTIVIYLFAQKVHPIEFSISNFIHFFIVFFAALGTVLLTAKATILTTIIVSAVSSLLIILYVLFFWLSSIEREKIYSYIRGKSLVD